MEEPHFESVLLRSSTDSKCELLPYPGDFHRAAIVWTGIILQPGKGLGNDEFRMMKEE